jgi:hypothetical protein
MGLLADFKNAAVARRRFPDDERLTPASIFALVRDMPYRRASDRRPQTTIEEWQGTCSGKHYLLHALYREFGLNSILIHAAYEVTASDWPWLPEDLQAQLREGPVPDVHTFLRLEIGNEWMTVDATWPLAASHLGLPVNERFEAGKEMKLACDPDELFHVPEDVDPQAFKEALLERHVGDEAERRGRFIEGLSEWLEKELYEVSRAP